MREKPDFGKKDFFEAQVKNTESPCCIWIPFIAIIGYIVFTAINRVISGYGNKLDQIICCGTLIGFVIMCILGIRDMNRDKEALKSEKYKWRKGCTIAEVAILSRHGYPGGTYEDGYGDIHSSRSYYHLDLETNADQRTVAPNQTVVSVNVDEYVYKMLEKCDTVRIYYKPESPMTFLLKEEL
jgi:hypothetical protein